MSNRKQLNSRQQTQAQPAKKAEPASEQEDVKESEAPEAAEAEAESKIPEALKDVPEVVKDESKQDSKGPEEQVKPDDGKKEAETKSKIVTVTSTHSSPLILPDGTLVPPKGSVQVSNWSKCEGNRTVQAWIKAKVISIN